MEKKLKSPEELSFNLNIALDKMSLCKIVRYNKKLCRLVNSEINFEKIHIPHITILMFNVKPKDADKVCEMLWDFASKERFKNLRFKKIRISGNYILLDTLDGEEIVKLSQKLESLINPYMTEVSHKLDTKDNLPHITLGWTSETEKAIRYFNNKNFRLKVKPSALRLSEKFCHGTVKNSFKIENF